MRRVMVLGNATLDVIQRAGRLPSPGETLLCDSVERCAGGKGLNQAVAAARAGADTVLIAPVGDDQDGRFLQDALADENRLDARWLRSPFPTDLSSIWVARNADNMILSSAASAGWVASSDALHALDDLQADDVLVLQGNLSRATTLESLIFARHRGASTFLNTAPIAWDMTDLPGPIDVVIANEIEAEQLSLLTHGGRHRAIVVTRGPAGALLRQDGRELAIDAPAVEAVDTAGAGDVMVGTLAAFLARGSSLERALEVAIKAASLSVTRTGTTSSFPSAREIEALAAGVVSASA